mmetsp:Transcript_615/g.1239  ORF Transcript_615/g.1239 Transcript_615/m.1239 type:complete len:505 (-) Transcript_615:173-1687(-)
MFRRRTLQGLEPLGSGADRGAGRSAPINRLPHTMSSPSAQGALKKEKEKGRRRKKKSPRSIMVLLTSMLKADLSSLSSAKKLRSSAREVPSGAECYDPAPTPWPAKRQQEVNTTDTREIVKSIYSKEHTLECRACDKKLIQKCRHCFACKGAPSYTYYTSSASAGASVKNKLLDLVLSQPSATSAYAASLGASRPKPYSQDARDAFMDHIEPIRVRTGPVPASRWRRDASLGPQTSHLLEKRRALAALANKDKNISNEMSPLAAAPPAIKCLKLPERYTNIGSLRVSAPSDMCMEKYSFAGQRALLKARSSAMATAAAAKSASKSSSSKALKSASLDASLEAAADLTLGRIVEARERTCSHGRYLETVYHVSRKKKEGEGQESGNVDPAVSKSRSTKSSPQSVLQHGDVLSSGLSSQESSGRFEGRRSQEDSSSTFASQCLSPRAGSKRADAAAKGPPSSEAKTKGEKKRKKRKGLDLISSFLNKCIMTEKKDHMCTSISTHVA